MPAVITSLSKALPDTQLNSLWLNIQFLPIPNLNRHFKIICFRLSGSTKLPPQTNHLEKHYMPGKIKTFLITVQGHLTTEILLMVCRFLQCVLTHSWSISKTQGTRMRRLGWSYGTGGEATTHDNGIPYQHTGSSPGCSASYLAVC